MATQLSPHFTLEEMILSQAAAREGIDNTPSPQIVQRLTRACALLEDVRTLLGGRSILISSGYRSPALNAAVGGANDSDHTYGLAADFTSPSFGSVLEVAQKIAASNLGYRQLIYEFGSWVHISAPRDTEPAPLRQNLSIFKGTGYLVGIQGKP